MITTSQIPSVITFVQSVEQSMDEQIRQIMVAEERIRKEMAPETMAGFLPAGHDAPTFKGICFDAGQLQAVYEYDDWSNSFTHLYPISDNFAENTIALLENVKHKRMAERKIIKERTEKERLEKDKADYERLKRQFEGKQNE